MTSLDAALAADPEVAGLIHQEEHRQQSTLQLIASENFTSPAVLAASGSVLTNKYSEGYPGKRYYGGNQIIDEVEDLARDRATALFGADHANVQPHAGANANLAVYQALLPHGATILAMRLDHGGHLTHGSPASITSKIWRFVAYGVTPASLDPDAPGRGHRFRPGGRPGQGRAARTDRGRLDRLCPHHRSPAVPGDRRLGGRPLHVRRRPSGRPHRRRCPSQPGRRGRRGDADHPQDAARPPRRRHPVRRRPGQEDRQRRLPRPPGWAARARHRGQGGGLRRGGPARVPHLRRPGGGQRRRPRPGADRPRASAWSRAAPTTTCSWSTCAPSTPSSPARWPRRCSTGPASPATATPSPTTPARPSSPRACAWARRPRPRPGMGGPEMETIAQLIGRTLRARDDEASVAAVRAEVADALRRLPALSRPARDRRRCPTSAGTCSSWWWRPAATAALTVAGPPDFRAGGLRGHARRAQGAHQAHPLRRRGGHVPGLPGGHAGGGDRAVAPADLPGLLRERSGWSWPPAPSSPSASSTTSGTCRRRPRWPARSWRPASCTSWASPCTSSSSPWPGSWC